MNHFFVYEKVANCNFFLQKVTNHYYFLTKMLQIMGGGGICDD